MAFLRASREDKGAALGDSWSSSARLMTPSLALDEEDEEDDDEEETGRTGGVGRAGAGPDATINKEPMTKMARNRTIKINRNISFKRRKA